MPNGYMGSTIVLWLDTHHTIEGQKLYNSKQTKEQT